jgi:NAD(P)-dependent dehydrogenase (short-subunit alcohol dehydrogenase family)
MNDRNPYSLKDKTILVTGASSGIGRSVAIEAAKLGATLVITGRNQDRLTEVFESLDGSGHRMLPVDILSAGERKLLLECLPPLDGVSHNAGIGKTRVFRFVNKEKIDSLMETNFTSTMLLQQEILKAGLIQDGASLVFTASAGASVPAAGNFVYAASKGAMIAGARVMAIELAPKKIRVNCVSPAMVETKLLYGGALTEADYEKNSKIYPLGRYGEPEEVAWMICYLLSDAARWVTGSNYVIDGGRSLV